MYLNQISGEHLYFQKLLNTVYKRHWTAIFIVQPAIVRT